MKLLTSLLATLVTADPGECPEQPSCGCSPEDVQAWEARIERWETEMNKWETDMIEWRERQALSKFIL